MTAEQKTQSGNVEEQLDSSTDAEPPPATIRLALISESALIWIGGTFCILALIAVIAVPFAYDNRHMHDTLLFAELGWRILNGFEPVLDFGHFYGGVVGHYVAWAFRLFGVEMKAIDYALVMMLLTAWALLALIAPRRLSRTATLALGLLSAACLLTRIPLEELTTVQKAGAAHSFVYNRFAIALAILLTAFALVPSSRRAPEIIAALGCGVAVCLIVLIKPTFLTFPPFFFAALALQHRWSALGIAALGALAGLIILDPGGARIIGALNYGIAAAGDRTSIQGMVLKCIAVFAVHPLELLLVAASAILLWRGRPDITPTITAAGIALGAGFAGMTATMGWTGSLGQQVLPFLAAIAIISAERLHWPGAAHDGMARFFAAALTLSFSLPHLAQTVLSGITGLTRASLIVPTGTPFDSYLAWSDDLHGPDGRPLTAPVDSEALAVLGLAHLESGTPLNVGVEYAMMIDGLTLLATVPDLPQRTIAAAFGGFGVLTGSQPAPGFPVWVNSTAPELSEPELLRDVDLVLSHRITSSPWPTILQQAMGDAFILCRTSVFWDLYARTEMDLSQCNTAND